jgi:putative transposase
MPAVPTQGSKNGVPSGMPRPAIRRDAVMSAYQTPSPAASDAVDPAEHLEVLIREALRTLLERLLAAEVDEYLGRARYERTPAFRGYRNGYARAREIGLGTWSLPVRAPRIAGTPTDGPRFRSAILPRRRYWSRSAQSLLVALYLEGLSSGDFEPVFRNLLGERAPLSPNTILRLKDEWQADYEAWRRRPLPARYASIWADGIYLDAGLEPEAACLLVVLGARDDGRKELLALELGYRESEESWAAVLRSLRERGLAPPRLAIGDGALGLWAALTAVYPTTEHQRCWNHRIVNVLDRLPSSLAAEARRRLRQVVGATSRAACEAARDEVLAWFRRLDQRAAAETLLRDWDDFTRFYDYPIEHWRHLRTSNPVEPIFAGVRLRTRVVGRTRRRDNALYLVFKLIDRLSINWAPLQGEPELLRLVVEGARFEDGILASPPSPKEASAA